MQQAWKVEAKSVYQISICETQCDVVLERVEKLEHTRGENRETDSS